MEYVQVLGSTKLVTWPKYVKNYRTVALCFIPILFYYPFNSTPIQYKCNCRRVYQWYWLIPLEFSSVSILEVTEVICILFYFLNERSEDTGFGISI